MKGKIRKWGNSFGILIPKKELDEKGLNEGQEVEFELLPNDISDLCGILAPSKEISFDEFMEEVKEGSR